MKLNKVSLGETVKRTVTAFCAAAAGVSLLALASVCAMAGEKAPGVAEEALEFESSAVESVDEGAEESVSESVGMDMTEAETEEKEYKSGKGVYDILLVGVDRRDDSWNGNSDVMILVTINYDKEMVYMTSFLRDLAADIPGIGVRKLNAACANGGVDLLVDTLETNFDLEIDNYALVDFQSMISVIDKIGGVDMEVAEDEIDVANGYIFDMCNQYDEVYEDHMLTEAGMQHLDGYQAVGYVRNRFTADGEEANDFGRTSRQRRLVSAVADQLRDKGALELAGLGISIMGDVKNDLNPFQLASLSTKLPEIMECDVEEIRIPYDDLYYSESEMLVPTMPETMERLHDTIY